MPVTASVISSGVGLVQSIFGGIEASGAQNKLEKLKTPAYAPNKAIADYYADALGRYNTGGYNTSMYQYMKNNADKTLATGLNSLSDRRAAIGNTGALVAETGDTLNKAAVSAEQQRNQEFGQLGEATQLKAGDDKYAFQVNQLEPYEKEKSLLEAKAGGGNATENAGIQNLFSGLNGITDYETLKKMYGIGGNTSLIGLPPANTGYNYGSPPARGNMGIQ